ncbi:kinase-like domain-containing protein [Geopyxis carbonaria]|nr:kinase-like domain-containing protein [Geopyxis carbonaria]
MDSAPNTACSAPSSPKSTTTSSIPPDVQQSASSAIERVNKCGNDDDELELADVTFLAEGGYNTVWLVTASHKVPGTAKRLVLRVPKEDTLLPHQLLNEVAFRSFVSSDSKLAPSIPVPKVLAYNLDPPWILEEFVEGKLLSTVWTTYSEREKEDVCHKLVDMVAALGETTFDGIGGLRPVSSGQDGEGSTAETELGPTVEGCKLLKGRGRFHSPECYDIGPYKTAREYLLAYYDKEIYYYTHAPPSDIDEDLFEDDDVAEFTETLIRTRAELEADESRPITADGDAAEEPFVAMHGDLHGRNILMNGTEVAAVLDWEFAGAYPLSELFEYIDVLEVDSARSEDENDKWGARIHALLREAVDKRGWGEREKKLLFGGGNPVLQRARVEMHPELFFISSFRQNVSLFSPK